MTCELCGRDVPDLRLHHLTPREEGGAGKPTAELCSACHRQVHALFENRTLARERASIAALLAEPQVRRFVEWVRRQDPARRIRVERAGSRRRGR